MWKMKSFAPRRQRVGLQSEWQKGLSLMGSLQQMLPLKQDLAVRVRLD
jgi:hypothetical protein